MVACFSDVSCLRMSRPIFPCHHFETFIWVLTRQRAWVGFGFALSLTISVMVRKLCSILPVKTTDFDIDLHRRSSVGHILKNHIHFKIKNFFG